LSGRRLHALAVGKAAAPMAAAFVEASGLDVIRAVAVGTHRGDELPHTVEWLASSHPYPDVRSERAGRRAIEMACAVPAGDVLVLLLSGGASALMAAPMEGVSLEDKMQTTRTLMAAGADIHALNAVRRHLSRVKGGRLAAACRGDVITLAISDVIGDELTAIGSGPGVPDPTTWRDVASILERWDGIDRYPDSVGLQVKGGLAGAIADTPKPGDPSLARASAYVIAGRADAMAGARAAAEARGYDTLVVEAAVQGEAREAAGRWWTEAARLLAGRRRPACVISSGETTVRVTGTGIGGRNLEFTLALVELLARGREAVAAASVGTDGIDGAADVAGAVADSTSLERAWRRGLDPPVRYLDRNDSLAFFAGLGDELRLGRTDTNVGDLQALVAGG
jgi:hydroxypyruvate reductase